MFNNVLLYLPYFNDDNKQNEAGYYVGDVAVTQFYHDCANIKANKFFLYECIK